MNRKGFIGIAILIAVLALAVIGGIVYVRYILPQQTHQSPAQMTSTTTSSAESAASAGCNNLDCLIAAAGSCTQITSTITESNSLGLLAPGILQNSVSNREITGTSGANCIYASKLISANAVMDQKFFNDPAYQNQFFSGLKSFPGVTDADIQKIKTAIQSGDALKQVQAQLVQMNQSLQVSIGSITTCTIPPSELVKRLQDEKNGEINIQFPDPYCKVQIGAAAGQSSPAYTSAPQPQTPVGNSGSVYPTTAIPSGVGSVTVYLSANEQSTINGVGFKVNSLSDSQLNVTVTDSSTGGSATVTFSVNQPMIVLGHDMVVMGIKETQMGTVNGQPIIEEQATLTYK